MNEPPPLETLLETVDGGFCLLDAEGRITWSDKAFSELINVDDASGYGQFLTSVFGDNQKLAKLETTETRNELLPTTLQLELEAGVHVELSLRKLPDGQSLGWVRDISERFQREQKLDRYRTLLSTVEDAIYATDENRQFAWVNRAAGRLLGYDRNTLLGKHLFEFLDDEQREIAKQNIEFLLSEETPDVITFELEVSRKDGTTFPAETRATLLPGDGFVGTVGIFRDISDRKERERELERKNERLETFADTISHDLRNPLNVALGRFELIEDECDSQHLQPIETALERMDDLIDELYTLAVHGQQVEDIEPAEIRSVAESAWMSIPTDKADLVVEESNTIEANPSRLQEMLENLLRNAVEHGGADVTVTVGELEAGFYVEDDGPGIPEEDGDDVFEAGYSTSSEGTGFGLRIVKQISDSHGWDITVTESDQGGARFEIIGVEFADG